MGIFDSLFGKGSSDKSSDGFGAKAQAGMIPGGKQKADGSHDHRTNTGNDRTPAQKDGDKKRRKD